jgi:hypothetical protein
MPFLKDLHGIDGPTNYSEYRLRLVFDQSPYRPLSEWKEGRGNYYRYMEGKTVMFVRQPLEKKPWPGCVVT